MLFVKMKITPRSAILVLGCNHHHDLVIPPGTLLLGVGYEYLSRVVLYDLFSYTLAVSK
tara:strand:- start:3311 stop:3487 length:177 start_codon:yes stop_codon:yes gene_type:complete